jgi:5-methylcytosine-specific restriction protein A
MPIMYKCSHRGCSKILEEQGLCAIHQAKADIVNKQRYKVYRTDRLIDKEQKKYHAFYDSKAWKKTRDSVIANCYGIDVVEYYRTGLIIQGYTVHHIIELSDDYNLKLDTDNLIYLTESNHQFIHREYNKGDREKKAIQKMLVELKKKFDEEFGI